jgi:hypothetical protein
VVNEFGSVWAREKTGGRRQEKNRNIECNFMEKSLKGERARRQPDQDCLLMEGNGSASSKEGALVFSGEVGLTFALAVRVPEWND